MPIDNCLRERILGENADTRIPEEQAGDDPVPEGRAMLVGGWISCAIGVLLAAGTVFAALLSGGANTTAATLGVGFGVLGYFLGSRKLATATVFLCTAAILFGLAASQGYVSWSASRLPAVGGLSAIQQVVPESRHERRARLPLVTVSRAQQGEAGAGEADLLTSEGLTGPSVLKC